MQRRSPSTSDQSLYCTTSKRAMSHREPPVRALPCERAPVHCAEGYRLMAAACPLCASNLEQSRIRESNPLCVFIQGGDPVLIGSGIIAPRAHRETVFDLSSEEFAATFDLLPRIRARLDRELDPDGYNLGWNCGSTAGQEIFHCHLHIIPRFANEPYAGRGIRYWLKQDANRRDASD